MKYLLDTNICVVHLRGSQPGVTSRMAAVPRTDIVLCSVVKAELIFGALRSTRAAENLQHVRRFFAGITSLPFDDTCAEQYGQIRATLARAGTPIGPNDLLVASIALAYDLTLVTHNLSEFQRVPHLRLEDWH